MESLDQNKTTQQCGLRARNVLMSQTAKCRVSNVSAYFKGLSWLVWKCRGTKWRKRSCGSEGMQECLVSHNSAKLEVNCCYCGQACFSHLGLLCTKPDPVTWLSFSFCLSLHWTWHPSSALTIYLKSVQKAEWERLLTMNLKRSSQESINLMAKKLQERKSYSIKTH